MAFSPFSFDFFFIFFVSNKNNYYIISNKNKISNRNKNVNCMEMKTIYVFDENISFKTK